MAGLQQLAEYTERMFRVACEFQCPAPVLVHNHTTATHLYRIAQEAVSNAVRHGKAKSITISLGRTGERLRLEVRDNGTGLPADVDQARGMGLRIMQYRAAMIGGSISVQSPSHGGTVVSCSIQNPTVAKDEIHHHHAKTSAELETGRPHH